MNAISPLRATSCAPRDAAAVREAVLAILPEIAARAGTTEADRRVPEENVALLREAGFFRLVQPRAFGGLEGEFADLVDLAIDVGSACTSTGWVCGLGAAHQWLVATFPLQAQHDVWDADPDTIVCGSYAPSGTIVPVESGFRASGRWMFASGCDVSGWSVCGTLLPPTEEGGKPTPAFLLVPRSDYAIDDTWNPVGMAGTGSKTLVLDGAFVPGHRVLPFKDACAGTTPGAALYDNPLYRLPLLSSIASCLAAAAVGAAQGALNSYLAVTSKRVTRGAVAGANNRMAEFPTIQLRVTEAAASVDAARTILLRDISATEDAVRTQGLATVEQRITSRRGQAFSVMLAVRAAEALNASTGGQGLDMANPVQRAWRDANAVGRHISMNWDAVGTMYGQMALGLEPKGQY